MTRYVVAVSAACILASTEGPRLLQLALATVALNVILHVWARLRGPIPKEATA